MKKTTPEEILRKHTKRILESDGVKLNIAIVDAMKEYRRESEREFGETDGDILLSNFQKALDGSYDVAFKSDYEDGYWVEIKHKGSLTCEVADMQPRNKSKTLKQAIQKAIHYVNNRK